MSTGSNTQDWGWIDYLENELDPGLERDLQTLLDHSQEDRDAFESFRQIREWLRGSDPIGNWPLETRLRRTRENVLREIATLPLPAEFERVSDRPSASGDSPSSF